MGRPEAADDEAERARPTVLLVSDERGWPRDSGYRRRTAQIATALAAVGPVTWVVTPRNSEDGGEPLAVPDDLRDGIDPVLLPAKTRGRLATLVRWLAGDLPWSLAAGDWTDVVAELVRRGEGDGVVYDVAWAMGVDALGAVRLAGIDAPVLVVDADLESLKLERRIAADPPGRIRRWIAEVDIGRWRQLEQRAATETTGFSVCSEDEARILGRGAFVTPNSYAAFHGAADGARDHNSLLFIGSLSYRPNIDGLEWFVDDVLPLLRLERPTVRLRVVGAGLAEDHRLHRIEGVHILGGIDDIEPELRRTSGVVVPVRWGAGTRIKILEAFAHRVPVVSTGLGAEGLGLTSGRELLLADDAAGFSRACNSILEADGAITAMVGRANETLRTKYEQSIVTHRLTRQVEMMVEGSG